MSTKGLFKNALFSLALVSLIVPEANAIEMYTGASPASLNNSLITQVRGARGGGGMRHGGGGMQRGGGGMHRGGGYAGRSTMAAERVTRTAATSIAISTGT